MAKNADFYTTDYLDRCTALARQLHGNWGALVVLPVILGRTLGKANPLTRKAMRLQYPTHVLLECGGVLPVGGLEREERQLLQKHPTGPAAVKVVMLARSLQAAPYRRNLPHALHDKIKRDLITFVRVYADIVHAVEQHLAAHSRDRSIAHVAAEQVTKLRDLLGLLEQVPVLELETTR